MGESYVIEGEIEFRLVDYGEQWLPGWDLGEIGIWPEETDCVRGARDLMEWLGLSTRGGAKFRCSGKVRITIEKLAEPEEV